MGRRRIRRRRIRRRRRRKPIRFSVCFDAKSFALQSNRTQKRRFVTVIVDRKSVASFRSTDWFIGNRGYPPFCVRVSPRREIGRGTPAPGRSHASGPAIEFVCHPTWRETQHVVRAKRSCRFAFEHTTPRTRACGHDKLRSIKRKKCSLQMCGFVVAPQPRTCTIPAAKPAAPPLNALAEAFFITSLNPGLVFSGSLPARLPIAGIGASARSAAVNPVLKLASTGLARAFRTNPPRRGMVTSSGEDMVIRYTVRSIASGRVRGKGRRVTSEGRKKFEKASCRSRLPAVRPVASRSRFTDERRH